ncbi:MAG: DUF1566 domain-containing protein [SAR324 cluster bacterium]|nr:DUF1566 domain-containing protein [SAR324 cluster bacterium]
MNDDVKDGDQGYAVSVSVNTGSTTDSSGYAALSAQNVSVTNTDDETAGLTISAISGNTSEEATDATFTVKLASQPSGDVVLNVVSNDTSEGTVLPASLTFTSSNWNTNQTVTVTGVNDSVADGNQVFTVSVSVNTSSTTDTRGYALLSASSVSVTNIEIDLTQGLAAYYPFNDNANDESGNSNHGTVNNSVTFVDGKVGKSAKFGGFDSSGYIQIPNSSSLQFSSEASFSFWLKVNDSWGQTNSGCSGAKVDNAPQTIFSKSGDRVGFDIKTVIDSNQKHGFWHTENDTGKGSVNSEILMGNWIHMTIIIGNNGTKFYQNGSLILQNSTVTTFSLANSEDIYMGIMRGKNSCLTWWYPMNGELDEFRIYNRALSTAEIQLLAGSSRWYQEAYVKAANAGASDNFGISVSVSGDTLVVGAPFESSNQTTITNGTTASSDNSTSSSGSAYVFKRNGTTWSQEAYIKASNSEAGDWFGISIAISGDTMVTGAYREDSNQITITNGSTASSDNSATEVGAAYVFKRTGTSWSQEAYLKAPNSESNDEFGKNVAISGDSVVVGAESEDSNQTTITNGTTGSSDNSASNSGAVYVFVRSGTTWSQQAYIKAPNAHSSEWFSRSIAILGDTLVVGTPAEDSAQTTITNGTTASSDNSAGEAGAVYVFRRSGTTWTQEAYLKASNAEAGDYFGQSVSISGDTIAVAASREDSNQTTITNGTTASSNNSVGESGAVYVFTRNSNTWSQQAYLKAPNAETNDYFGENIFLSSDTLVVGARQEDSNQTTITNGTTASADNSASSSGAAYVFVRSGTTWSQQAYLKASNAEAGDSFGQSVSISGDTIVVGANYEDSNQTTITNGTTASADNSAADSGAVYVYRYSGNAPTVSSTSPADGGNWMPGQSTGWVVNFSQAMSTSTITTNTSDTTCSGSVQVSSDSFSTCVRMSAAPVASNSNYSFTLTPYASLTGGTTYKIRVTTGAQSSGGTALASTWTHSTGILVTVPVPDTGQTTSYTTTFGEDHDYTTHTPSYTDNGNSTVTDNITGLMWQKEDDNNTYTWENAGTYCDNLSLGGYTDWRLPRQLELMSIVSYGVINPSINSTYFPNTNSSYYWSSSSDANLSGYAWRVYFYYGNVSSYVKSSTLYVRCVRGGS